jgi:hypothetical protein
MTPKERKELDRLLAKYPNMHPRVLTAQFLNDRQQQRNLLKQMLIDIAATPSEIKSIIG